MKLFFMRYSVPLFPFTNVRNKGKKEYVKVSGKDNIIANQFVARSFAFSHVSVNRGYILGISCHFMDSLLENWRLELFRRPTTISSKIFRSFAINKYVPRYFSQYKSKSKLYKIGKKRIKRRRWLVKKKLSFHKKYQASQKNKFYPDPKKKYQVLQKNRFYQERNKKYHISQKNKFYQEPYQPLFQKNQLNQKPYQPLSQKTKVYQEPNKQILGSPEKKTQIIVQQNPDEPTIKISDNDLVNSKELTPSKEENTEKPRTVKKTRSMQKKKTRIIQKKKTRIMQQKKMRIKKDFLQLLNKLKKKRYKQNKKEINPNKHKKRIYIFPKSRRLNSFNLISKIQKNIIKTRKDYFSKKKRNPKRRLDAKDSPVKNKKKGYSAIRLANLKNKFKGYSAIRLANLKNKFKKRLAKFKLNSKYKTNNKVASKKNLYLKLKHFNKIVKKQHRRNKIKRKKARNKVKKWQFLKKKVKLFRKLTAFPSSLIQFLLQSTRSIVLPPSTKVFKILKILVLMFKSVLKASMKKQFFYLTLFRHCLCSLLNLPRFLPKFFIIRIINLLLLKEFSFKHSNIKYFEKIISSRYLIFQGAYSAIVSSLNSFDRNEKIRLSFFAMHMGNLTASLTCNYIIYKLSQYFKIQEIFRLILRDLKYSPNLTGFRIVVAGRLTRKERAAYLIRRGGHINLSVKSLLVDYASDFIIMRFGVVGVKVWMHQRIFKPTYYVFKFTGKTSSL